MATAPRKAKRSAKQAAASKAWASAGRAKQKATRAQAIAKTGKPPPRSKAQKAATQKFQTAGAQATHARSVAAKLGVQYQAPKKAAAPLEADSLAISADAIHLLPVCAAVVLAEHLLVATGVFATDEEILSLANLAGDVSLPDLLELVRAEGFCGMRLTAFRRMDPGLIVPALVCGVETENGYHAALAHPAGMLSWGMVLPWPAAPAEAWYLEWTET